MTIKTAILALLETNPATHEEIARKLDKPDGTIRRVTQELRKEGRITIESYYGSCPLFRLRKAEAFTITFEG